MLEIIIKSACIVLLVYAVISIITKFVDASKNHDNKYFVVLKISTATTDIEFAVRSIIWSSLSVNGGGFIPDILIVDCGADKEIREVVHRLINEYDFIYYITEENYNEFKNNFMIWGKNDKI